MAKVNLDALISREDFEVEENITSGKLTIFLWLMVKLLPVGIAYAEM
jgi:hypothetical protein